MSKGAISRPTHPLVGLARLYGKLIRIPVLGGLIRLPILILKYFWKPAEQEYDDTADRLRFLTDHVAALRERVDGLEKELAQTRGQSTPKNPPRDGASTLPARQSSPQR